MSQYIESSQISRYVEHVKDWPEEKQKRYRERCDERNVHYFDIAYPHLCVFCGCTENEFFTRNRKGETKWRFKRNADGQMENVLEDEDEVPASEREPGAIFTASDSGSIPTRGGRPNPDPEEEVPF